MPVLDGHNLVKRFRREKGAPVTALNDVSFTAEHGTLTALVGPDGAGKTTLIRLMTGLLTPDAGTLKVLDIDVAVDPQQVQTRIGYMPQKFGLYEDLSVHENLDLYADLHGVTAEQRGGVYPGLLSMTGLGPFTDRLAGRLSGGMKQKLGLACTLVRSPELLLLDEPTVGVDPLSRRELWEIIMALIHDRGLTVVLSTSYLDEAERCGHVIILQDGKVLAQGPPVQITQKAANRVFIATPPEGAKARDLQAKLIDDLNIVDALPIGGRVRLVRNESAAGKELGTPSGASVEPTEPRFEDGFMVILRQLVPHTPAAAEMHLDQPLQRTAGAAGPMIQVRNLVRRFGAFTAVDHVSFQVERGEIFGLLGPNGAGKTTTFRMLCGLLRASEGTLEVAGVNLLTARANARQRLGYVAQKFLLYGQLSVIENLEFFASAYSLRGERRRQRIDWALDNLDLRSMAKMPSGELPGGYRQRLAMAAALLHEPQILFLDEPTSGADPLARREFWRRITALAQQQVTIIVTTHFMEEAEYCDRIAIMDSGRILAQGTPAEIRTHARETIGKPPAMEDAFIAIVEESRQSRGAQEHKAGSAG